MFFVNWFCSYFYMILYLCLFKYSLIKGRIRIGKSLDILKIGNYFLKI